MQKKDQRTKETNKTDTGKNTTKTLETKDYNIFSVLSQKEPRHKTITSKNPKPKRHEYKGTK